MLPPLYLAIIAVVVLLILWAAGVFNKKPKALRSRQRYQSRLGTKADPADPTTGYPEWLFTNFNINGNNILVGENFDLRNINLNSSGSNAQTWYEQIIASQKSGVSGNDVFTRNVTSGLLNLADMTNPANYGKGAGFLGCLPFVLDTSGKATNANSSNTNSSVNQVTNKLGGNISLPFDLLTSKVTYDHTTTTKTTTNQTYQMASQDFRTDFGYVSLPLSNDESPLPIDAAPSYCLTNNINEQFIVDFISLASAGANYGFVGSYDPSHQGSPYALNIQASDFVNYSNFLNKYGTHIMTKMYFGNRIAMLWNDYSNDSTMSESVFSSLCVAGSSPASISMRENYSDVLIGDPPDCSTLPPSQICACVNSQNSQTVNNSLENTTVEVTGGSASTSGPVISLLVGGYKSFIDPSSATTIGNFLASTNTDASQGINFDFAPIWVIIQIVFQTFTTGYIPSTFATTTSTLIKILTASGIGQSTFNMMIVNLKLAYTQLIFCEPVLLNGNQVLQGFMQTYPTGTTTNIMDNTGALVPNPVGMSSQCWTNTGSTKSGDGTGCVQASDCDYEPVDNYTRPGVDKASATGSTLVNVPYGYSCVAGQSQIDPTVMTHVPISSSLGPTSTQYGPMQSWGNPNYAGCSNPSKSVCYSNEGDDVCVYKDGPKACNNELGSLNFQGQRVVWDAASQLDTCGNLNLN
jgi:hypothetical protein